VTITDLSAVALRDALQARQLSAQEVMRDYLLRIEQVNPRINAIVSQIDADTALAAADLADSALARGNTGPLTGFPLAVKDLADVRGFKTSHGSPLFGKRPAKNDCIVAERLRAAGGVFIGKTNAPEFGFGSHTFNRVFGTTVNPFDPTRSAGGSSGGAAAALASHMLPLADGSDFGGSLRNPASFCGIVGMRPSVGRVPAEAVLGWSARIAVQGPMARNVGDLALLLSVIAGFDARDPLSCVENGDQFSQSLEEDFTGSRIAWTRDFDAYPVDAAVHRVCKAALGNLQAIGCVVDEAHPDVTGAMDAFQTQRAAAVRSLGESLQNLFPDWRQHSKDTAIWNIEKSFDLDFTSFQRSEVARTRITRTFVDFFEHWDFLVLPTVQVLPFPADQEWVQEINGQQMATYLDWMSSCCVVSLTDLPALSLPVGLSAEGLPVGLQIVGPPKSDLAVLKLAHALEADLALNLRPPI